MPQTGTFFGLKICIWHFCLLIAQLHHVRFKVMEYKQIGYEIALGSNGRQMVWRTKRIWGIVKNSEKRLENSMFRISFFYLLWYVPFIQNFNKKMHAGCCYWWKIWVKWLICSNRDLFWKLHIILYTTIVWCNDTPSSYIKFEVLTQKKIWRSSSVEVPPKVKMTPKLIKPDFF